ncbi:unnamed protein product [Periconia digitata]|uniref:Uncharacterized protein n=1 Tax=Periconia digitata TaxID=1303443 RepID=A0A9W4U1K6_9PLEO|nr:unnamed protein product [Periconia digitata]
MHPEALHLLNTLTLLSLTINEQDIPESSPSSSPPLPSQCQTICSPVVELMSECAIDKSKTPTLKRRKDSAISESTDLKYGCICENKSFDVKAVSGLCASCLSQNSGGGGEKTTDFFGNFMFDRELGQVLNRCDFPMGSYAPSATTLVQGVKVSATASPTPTGSSNSKSTEGDNSQKSSGSISASSSSGSVGGVEASLGILGIGFLMATLG